MLSLLYYYSLFPYLKGAENWLLRFLDKKKLRLDELFDEETSRGVYFRLISGIREWKLESEESSALRLFFHPRNQEYGANYYRRHFSQVILLREILTYFGSIAVLAEIGDRWAKRRYSIFESKRFTYLLGASGGTENEILEEIARELGMELEISREVEKKKVGLQEVEVERYVYRIPFPHFLKSSPSRVGKWKMINHVVYEGKVWIYNKKELIRLMQHFVARKVEEDINKIEKRKRGRLELPEPLKDVLNRIKNEIEAYKAKMREVTFGEEKDFPPCMRAIISQIRSGTNVTHQGRFAITTFLHKIGWPEERILDLMRNLPDFDERVATYQVKHILGEISRKEYEVPSCDTMRSYGLCVPDEFCRGVKHPLQYLRKKTFLRKRRGKE